MAFPHGSAVSGSLVSIFTAALLNSAGSMRLLTNGAFKLICRPPLHAGEANAVKSPVSMAGVATHEIVSDGSSRTVVPRHPPKKHNLLRVMGPPLVPPYRVRF